MQPIAALPSYADTVGYLGPATVVSSLLDGERMKVSIKNRETVFEVWAQSALAGDQRLTVGDEVLVIGNQWDELYIIGRLSSRDIGGAAFRKITLPDGVFATVDASDNPTRLKVLTKENKLLCEYDSKTGKLCIAADSEQLRISARKGDIELDAAARIRLNGQVIELAGKSGVNIEIADLFQQLGSTISLKPGKMSLSAQEVAVTAKRSNFVVNVLIAKAKKVVSKAEYVHQIADKIETMANTILEKAQNKYSTVENLNQQRAGRMRMLIQRAFHLKGKNAVIKAAEDVKVKGEKIHLG